MLITCKGYSSMPITWISPVGWLFFFLFWNRIISFQTAYLHICAHSIAKCKQTGLVQIRHHSSGLETQPPCKELRTRLWHMWGPRKAGSPIYIQIQGPRGYIQEPRELRPGGHLLANIWSAPQHRHRIGATQSSTSRIQECWNDLAQWRGNGRHRFFCT